MPGSKSPRLWLLLLLDLVLLGSGVGMAYSYFSTHENEEPAKPPARVAPIAVESMPPMPVERELEPEPVVAVAPPASSDAAPVAPAPDAGVEEEPLKNSPEDVARVAKLVESEVGRLQDKLERCYADAALRRPGAAGALAGRLDVRFTIAPDGSASQVRVVRNTTDSSVLAACVKRLVSGFRIEEGPPEPMDFSWPFVFRGDE